MALTTDQLKKYWDTANILRKNLDAAEYKHIVLGLVFLNTSQILSPNVAMN